MSNNYYNHTTYPVRSTKATSSLMRAELDAIDDGFDKLPVLTANGGKVIAVNAGATALEAVTSVSALNITTSTITTGTITNLTASTTASLPAGATGATATAGDSTTKLATTAFVMGAAFSAALPAQAGNSGKFVTTDGSNASWALPIADQATHSGKFLTTNGTTTSWSVVNTTPFSSDTSLAQVQAVALCF